MKPPGDRTAASAERSEPYLKPKSQNPKNIGYIVLIFPDPFSAFYLLSPGTGRPTVIDIQRCGAH
jgi:hypothetical protein